MKKLGILSLMLSFLAFGASGASATSLLDDWAFNVDGTTYEQQVLGDTMPTNGSLDSEGLGILTWATSVACSHNFIAFFDHEIDQLLNTFFNEYGATTGTPESVAAGDYGDQSWKIDDPWSGDIYFDVLAGSLDDTNAVPQATPGDVSMAIGWNFDLAADQTATIRLILGDTAPVSGFYLSHTDPETGTVGIDYSPEQTIYFSSTLDIQGGGGPTPPPVPEPGTMLLMGTGLVGLFGLRRRKFRR